MNLTWILLSCFSNFALVEETFSTNEPELYRDGTKMPLALIKIHNSSEMQLAIPYKYEKKSKYAGYYYDIPEDENGPIGELIIACPPYYQEQTKIEKNWIKNGPMTHYDELLFILNSQDQNKARCDTRLKPSIKKLQNVDREGKTEYCGRSQAEIHQVGYWVSNEEETDIQFLSMYEMCYSKIKDEGVTLYSIHRIVSPSLLLQDLIRELPQLKPYEKYYEHESILAINFDMMDSFRDLEYYSYQFVGIDDMLHRLWQRTTMFPFNYTAITRNADIFKGMIRADNYIRLYSKKNNKPLTLYSGTNQQLIESSFPCISKFCEPTKIDSFWRIIMDDDGNAVILVTQHTLKKCDDQVYLCEKNRKVKEYKNGGCTYTCSLNEDARLLEVLGLPHQLTINGDLDFTFKTDETKAIPEERRGWWWSDKKSSKSTDIIDFLSNATFMSAMENVDANIASQVEFLSASDDHDAGGGWWL